MAKAGLTIAISGTYNGRALDKARQDLEKLRIKAVAEMGGAGSSLINFGGKTAELGGQIHSLGYKMESIGDAATKGITLPIVAAAVACGKAAVDMDTALTGVRKTVDGTESQYQALKKSAVEFSKTNAVSASQIMEMQALGAQLGYNIDELELFAGTVAGLDIATDMNAEQAGTELAQFANITKMAHSKTGNYASAIVGLGNNMATTESKISAMAMRLGAAGTQVGMSQADILGLSAALSSMGIEAEAGGSAMSTVISQIDKDVAKGSKSVSTWAAAAGMSADQFATAWRTNPVKALGAVLSGMEGATRAGGNMSVMLDNLGVSSLRQTDTLKRLAGNSDLVTKAVELSNTEWNKNTALSNEVENRNQSLAARFQILQNRVVAVAEEVGTPLVNALMDVVDAAAPVFDGIADVARGFSEMSAEGKRGVVQLVASAAAFGPVTSAAGGLLTGLGDLVTGVGKGMQKFGLLRNELGLLREATDGSRGPALSLGQALGTLGAEKLPTVTAALGMAKAALASLGIAAAIALIGAAIAKVSELIDRQRTLEDATAGLETAIDEATKAYESYSGGAERASRSVSELRESTDETIGAQAELTNQFKKQWKEIGTNAATVDAYARDIQELTSQTSLSEKEQAKLKSAVEGYNSVTGDSIEVTNALRGQLSVSTDAILKNAEAFKQQARSQAAQEMYVELYKQQIDNELQLKDVREKLTSATANQSRATIDMYNGASTANVAIGDLRHQEQELESSIASNEKTLDSYLGVMSEADGKFATMDAALSHLGLSMKDFSGLSDSQLAKLRRSFDGTLDSIERTLAEFGMKITKDGGKAAIEYVEDTTDRMAEIGDAAAEAVAQSVEEATKALEKELGNQYKAQSKAYDREYKAQSKAFDASAKLQSKAFDEEARLLEKSHQSRLSEIQKEIDAEYSTRSKALSAEADAVSKSLSSELDEYRKHNDKVLAEVKSAQESQVSAYEKATDEKIAQIEREYKAALGILDGQEDERTKAIDAQIAALEAETEAEQRAQKRQEQEQRKTQLQKAVNQAESADERRKAEQDLADYLADLARQEREEQRKQTIGRLQEQKDAIKAETAAKKESLKEQYDQRVSSTKEARAAELEEIRAANEREYEAEAARLEKLEEQRAEANSLRVEQIREANEQELANLKEYGEMYVEQVREEQRAEEDALREGQQAITEETREHQSEQLESLREFQSEQLESLRESQSEQVEALRQSLEEQAFAYGDMASEAQAGGKGVFDNLRETMSKVPGMIGEKFKSALFGQKNETSKMKSDAKETGKNIKSGVEKGIFGLPASMKGIMGNTRSSMNGETSKMPADAKAAANSVSGLTGDYKGTGSKAGNELKNSLNNKSGEVKGAAENLRKSAKNGLSGSDGDFTSAGVNAGQKYSSGVGSVDTYNNGMKLGRNAANGMRAVDAYNDGTNFARGFSDGMNSYDLWTAAWNVGISALNGIRAALGIASPSKEAMEVGRYFGKGAEIGMRSTEGDLRAEAERMSEAMSISPSAPSWGRRSGGYVTSYSPAGPAGAGGGVVVYMTTNVNVTTQGPAQAAQVGANLGEALHEEFARRMRFS